MQFEFAKVSLTGHRADNQDRVDVIVCEPSVLMIVVDGMGGHAHGAEASEVIVSCIARRFRESKQPVFDPQGFLIGALTEAHQQVVALGKSIPLEQRPRATCAVCLVQDASAYCAHVGDSRIYQFRNGGVLTRSRDHSHVELLLNEGAIDESEVNTHPMRNFVECCLGGEEPLPDMSVAPRSRLEPDDVVLVCSDGLWSGADDEDLSALAGHDRKLERILSELAERAVAANAPASDNTSAAALRFLGASQ